MKKLIIFASGSGSNAENLITHFNSGDLAKVVAVFTNNPNAGVIARAEKYGVPVVVFDRSAFADPEQMSSLLHPYQPDLLVLAGFLWLLPVGLVHKYPNKIVNIHPALLPKYGGKGMYGNNVHKTVLEAGEQEHGITIHMVNEHYDDGEPILQKYFAITPDETLESLSTKIHELEFEWYPKAIEMVLNGEK